jgi:uncharacterized protein YndB with AHSA1/START domain
MAVNSIVIEAPPEAVYEVLGDGREYAAWVVGAHHSGPVDRRWPEPGSTLVHRSGVPPLTLQDTTSVVSADPPSRIRLEARVRPLLVATVDITVQPHADGSMVTMEERVVGGLARHVPAGLHHAVFRRRNTTSLARLRAIVLSRAATADGGAPAPER